MMEMKYILVTGGVISGIGKGIIASSIGAILKHHGLKVTSIKIDPYINIDAGTFSPFEHGEVYVLDDGGEVDLDLGNYERYLDITLNSDNNITTGKIYSTVIANERKGDYLGKTVQVNPHITDAIQEWIERVARIPVDEDQSIPEVCIIELGGTIGDIEGMQFVEAFRKFQFKAKPENFCTVHVSLVPHTSSGEEKTKPTQVSVRELRRLGITPDFIVCRSARPVDSAIKQKIFDFCHVPPERVFCLPDVKNLYSVPMMLENQDASNLFSHRLQLGFPSIRPEDFMIKWRNIIKKQELATQTVKIALVGKYVKLEEAYASVTKALRHASIMCNRKLELKYIDAEDIEEGSKNQKSSKFFKAWHSVCEADGIIVPGGFGSRGLEGKISACNYARTHNIPFLGVCLGLQAAVIEFARNVMHWPDANSQEAVPEGTKHVVIEMPEHNPGIMGGTMRLGKRQTVFTASSAQSKIRNLYHNVDFIEERHRHRYEVNPQFVPDFREAGMQFVGEDETGQRMEIMELSDHPYYVACQFHPEYLSRPLKPSPPYVGLIFAASKKLDGYLAKTSQFTQLEFHDVIDEQLNAESILNTSFQHISVNSNED